MTSGQILLATVAMLLVAAVITALVDRWAHRKLLRRRLGLDETGDDTRQIDIIKRGDVLPFRRAD